MALSREDKQKILSEVKKNGFNIWPVPKAGVPYGPMPMQFEVINIPHKHSLDICLIYGGARGGKTQAAVSTGINYALKNPGIDIMIGCEEYKHLERTTLADWRKAFSISTDFDHPLISKRLTSHNKFLRFINTSTALFMHFKEWDILRGSNLGFAHIDEASLCKDVATFGEIKRRMSSTKAKQKQILITTNPEESHGWIFEEFELEKFKSDYEGPDLPHTGFNLPYPNKEYWERMGYDLSKSYARYIGPHCNCQLCQNCSNKRLGKFEYSIDGVCPNCHVCSVQGCKKGTHMGLGVKETDCPGDQQFIRVIMTDSIENLHLDQDYRQTQELVASEREFQLYMEGNVMELRTGFVYEKFSTKANKLQKPVNFDPTMDMHWSFDFNISYQCSVIVQEKPDPIVVDEIVLPEAGPPEVAIEWLNRYSNYEGNVYIYFDPAAFNRSVTADDGAVRVKMIRERLENPDKFRFDIEKDPDMLHPLFPKSTPKKVVLITKKEEKKTKVAVNARVDSLNEMLNNGSGATRLTINPKCEWLLSSLANLKWKEVGGTPVIDVQCDKLAAKAVVKTKVRTLSHPTDALGYYIYKRFPLVKARMAEMYAYLPGNPLIKTTPEGEVVEVAEAPKKQRCLSCNDEFINPQFTFCPKDGYRLVDSNDPKLVYSLDQENESMSFRQVLESWGSFDSPHENPFNMYW